MKTSAANAQAAIAALVGVLGASACQDPLVDPAVVIAPRVVGARVRSDADPTLAEPLPGERASIDWLLLSDQRGPFVAKALWCRGTPTSLGTPRCDGPPAAEATSPGVYGDELPFSFQVPDGLQPGDTWLAWLGVCDAGEPVFDATSSAFSCPTGEALAAYYRGFVPGGAPNHNPSLADDAVGLDGVAWTAEPGAARAPREPCRGATLPTLIAGTASTISFALGGDDRELLDAVPDEYAAHPRESLVFTHVASHAGLERAFSAIDYDAQSLTFELTFHDQGEAAPAADGETLIFHLLVRDERGGVDWLRREACLLPPGP